MAHSCWKPNECSLSSDIAAVLLYNLVLLHHRVGLRSGTSVHVKAAIGFYTHSLTVLESSQETPDSPLKTLLTALLNNTAHAYTYFFELSGAEAMYDDLAWQIEEMLLDEDVQDEDIVFFESSLLLFYLEINRFSASPAA